MVGEYPQGHGDRCKQESFGYRHFGNNEYKNNVNDSILYEKEWK